MWDGSPVLPRLLQQSSGRIWGSPGSHILTLSCSALWMCPGHRDLRESCGHPSREQECSVRGALLPCPVGCLLGSWVCKIFFVSRDTRASLAFHIACLEGSVMPPILPHGFVGYAFPSFCGVRCLRTASPIPPVPKQITSGKVLTENVTVFI